MVVQVLDPSATAAAGRGYSTGLALLLREAARSGLFFDFTTDRHYLLGRRYRGASSIPGWSYTRSGTRFAGDSALTSFSANTPRIVPGSGIRVTAGATNLLLQSQTFDNASWANNINVTLTGGQLAPDGSSTAYTMAGSSAVSNTKRIGQNAGSAAQHTLSFFVRANTHSFVQMYIAADVTQFANFNVSAGTVGTVGAGATAAITALGSGWFRCSMTVTLPGSSSPFLQLVDSASASWGASSTTTNSVFIWGAQLETGSTATDYIPTTTASATAGADAASVTGLTFSGAHSVIALTGAKGAAGNELVFQFDDGTNNNRTAMYRTSGNVIAFSDSGAVNQATQNSGTWLATAQRFAMRNQTNDVRAAVDGVLGAADTVATLPAGTLSRLRPGANDTLILNGLIQLLAILPRALSDGELTGATA